ncbi:MAG: glycerol-3-phosphate 1-O-acyltransferase PlsY [Pseudomonadota bacterium]
MIDIVFKLVLAYLLGSVSGSLLLGRLKKVDIRTVGSGNAGGTNALRTQGKLFALGVIVIDIGKGALAAGWVPTLTLVSAAPIPHWLPYACAALSVVGHCYPIFYGFRGGKGAATLVGTYLVFAPTLVLPMIAVWLFTIMLTGFVGLATMITGHAAWVVLLALRGSAAMDLVIYAFVMAVFVVYTHRSNIVRMRDGTENQNTRLMVFKKS